MDERENGHMNGNNPYNCAVPGNQFVGYEDLRQDVLDGFRNGHSYALIGGRRCGKTSLLLQLAKDLREGYKLSSLWPLPRLLDIQGLDRPTPHLLFQRLYELTVEEIDAPTFSPGETAGAYQQFLAALKKAAPLMEQRYGPFWVVIFLIDELDAAVDSLPNDQFFQNLRNLLMMSDYKTHFRLVASGVTGMAKLIWSGSSPLNNLTHKYLSILSHRDAIQLILSGFGYVFDEEIKNFLFQCTGRHPYLMQGILEKLWNDKGVHDQVAIQRAAQGFLREHSDFRRWVESLGPAGHTVYQILADAPGGSLTRNSIRQKLDPSMASQVGDALTVLSYHGVIDDSDPQNPQIAGTMFRDWYQDNVPKQEKPKASELQRPQAIRVFYSYSHKDEPFREELETHLSLLKRQGVIEAWHDRKITAGQEWANAIDQNLEAAHIILLLVSADFLASDYCYDVEMKAALKRHNDGEACVVPIITRPVDWSGALFGKLQALPKDAKPVTTWPNRDEAWLNVAQGIRRAVEELRKRS
jgi:hypothetical protein